MKKPIGLFLNGIETEYGLPILKGIDEYCSQNDLDYFVYLVGAQTLPERQDCHFTKSQIGLASVLNKNSVSSILTTVTSSNVFCTKEDYHQFLKTLPVPVVSIGIKFDGISCIVIDNYSLTKELTEHLIKKHNAKKFLLVKIGAVISDIEERIAGFYDALKEAGIPKDNVTVIETTFKYGDTTECLKRFKTIEDCCFDSVFCIADVLAIEVAEYFEKIGIRVPQDVKVTSFDDCLAAVQTRPPLTTINQMLENQGIEACRVAVDCAEQI